MMTTSSIPYTGGDPMKSGELGKMVGIVQGVDPRTTYPSSSSLHNRGQTRLRRNSNSVSQQPMSKTIHRQPMARSGKKKKVGFRGWCCGVFGF